MLRLLRFRLLAVIPTIVLVSLLTFALSHLLPGSVGETILGAQASPEAVAEIETSMGLDKPLPTQYMSWAGDALRGDFGESIAVERGQEVRSMITSRLPTTLSLAGFALLLAVCLGIPAGALAAFRSSSLTDRVITVVASIGLAVPSFWLAIVLVRWLASELGWFPSFGYSPLGDGVGSWLHSLVLPALALGLPSAALIARQSRAALLEVLQQDYIRTALAVGLRTRTVLFRYALKNAMVPIITIIGFQAAFVLGGSVVIERVFGLPGFGSLALKAVLAQDIPVVQAYVLFIALLVILINLVVDVSYGWFNPKVRQ
ncbi:ABC transporter permease [Desertimonas flava]|uniref:ABC transporter permease n=1 Tax=Desertimonas flava TaxID=2064846 RepID=UPI000E350D66|nr:ABC transporter permease [Desertimonas flava]